MTETVFSKILRREIPATIVFENERVLAFRDINPVAPVHVLVIPKSQIESMASITQSDQEVLGELMVAASEIAKREGIADQGYRIVVNTGSDGGQTVGHLHLHVLGGRQLSWPPG